MWHIGGKTVNSRLLLGTAQYPSPEILRESILASRTQIVTVSLRRQNPAQKSGEAFWDILKSLDVNILPNTAGCRSVQEAVNTARMARELFDTSWIKLEVIGDDYTLQPNPFDLLEAARILNEEGFEVFPYTTDDLVLAQKLRDVGCKILMPWAAPIGSGQGLNNPRALETLRARLPELTLIVDAGLGKPSEASRVMEMGFDGVLLNTAVALSHNPPSMARAFADAVDAGYSAHRAGLMPERHMAHPSTPTIGTPFWHMNISVQSEKLPSQASASLLQCSTSSFTTVNSSSARLAPRIHPAHEASSHESESRIAWTVAGSDPGGGAGIQADLKTFQSMGVYGCAVITALTAQNTCEVTGVEYPFPDFLKKQIETLLADMPPPALKIGMVGSKEVAQTLAEQMPKVPGFKLYDPVKGSTTGHSLIEEDTKQILIHELIPQMDLITPNRAEAEWLLGTTIETTNDVEHAAKALLAMGAKSVLLKGGDVKAEFAQDFWTNGEESFWLTSLRVETRHTHGTGCTLSAAITACVALGYDLRDALVIAKAYVNQGLRLSPGLGRGHGPLAHIGFPEYKNDLPWLTPTAEEGQHRFQFANCEPMPLGFYPIVNRAEWLEKLLPLGVTTVQLRVKDLDEEALDREIAKASQLAKQYNARLFINDYWQLAIKHQAYGVHLGQDDLKTADLKALEEAGIRLGVSTHCFYEVARALAIRPSYMAIGPIHETTTKQMIFAPQGIDKLSYWRKMLDYPLVAIGGIFLENASEIIETGVDAIAVVRDVTQAENLKERVNAWQQLFLSRSPSKNATSHIDSLVVA